MALDGQPAEPFPARNGALVLAPGGRADAFIDATAPAGAVSAILLHDGKEARPIARLVTSNGTAGPRRTACQRPPPLPSNGLPDRLDLKNALRFDLALGGPQADWVAPADFHSVGRARVSRPRPDRTVVLALTNRGRIADRLPPPWPSFPAAGPARRRLETVLAGHAGDRARADPAHRLRRRICRAAG